MPAQPVVLFTCVDNAGRSPMAAGFLRSLTAGAVDARSAGSTPAEQVDPVAAAAMAEIGIDITGAAPRRITPDDAESADLVITVGRAETSPAAAGARRVDWPLADPSGRTLPEARAIRDDIRARVEDLIPGLTRHYPDSADASAAAPVKDRVRQRVQRARGELTALSHAIHSRPETAFNETDAARRVTALLAGYGFTVEHGAGGLDTAFTAVYGTGDLTIGLCAEYDALPEIGHACGHNIIAAAAAGAALGLTEAADELGIRITVIGTPAEESGGGKIRLLERGVFDDVSAAMMVHPEGADVHPADVRTPAVARLTVTYTGRPAHAAATPHLGVNAADAAVVAQVAVGLLRQQLTGDCRIGLYVRDGGTATNIIPESSVLECEVRAHTTDTLADLRRRVTACFEAGAHATGADVDIADAGPDYAALEQDPALVDRFARNLAALGREPGQRGVRTVGSTDMGNVTRALPGIHPMIGIRGAQHRPHTRGFADEARSPAADEALLDGAVALALTGVDMALDPPTRERLITAQRERRAHRESPGR